jgi:Spy/CpxP family protein refolding chaperone
LVTHLRLQTDDNLKTEIMKTQKSKWLGLLAAALLLTSINVNAQNRNNRERQRPAMQEIAHASDRQMEERGPKKPMIPNLSEEQKEQIKEFRLAAEKSALPLKNQVGEKEARLKTLTTAEVYDAKSTDKVIEEIGKLRTDLLKLKVATEQKVKGILTDEQLAFVNSHGPGKGDHRPKGKR